MSLIIRGVLGGQAVLVLMLGIIWAVPVIAQEVPGCGSLRNAFGPFDYRDPSARQNALAVVEAYHFTAEVAALQQGRSSTLAGDLDYTLRAFPNHRRALASMARYALRNKQDAAALSVFRSPECFFRRAIAFAPDDETVRAMFANYLHKTGETALAREQYEAALRLAPQSAEINYNAGLFFLDLGEIDRAKTHAKVAYDAGYPLPGLMRRIRETEQ